jgi:hypothetical protein
MEGYKMTKVLGLLSTLLLGKFLGTDSQRPSVLLRLPMLMVRKVIQLFMVGFGALLVGVIAVGFFLRDVTFQLQTQGQLFFSASMWVSGILAIAAFVACGFVMRKRAWVNPDDLTLDVPMPPQPQVQQADATHAITTLLFDYLENRRARRAASTPAPHSEPPFVTAGASDYNLNKEMHYDYKDDYRQPNTVQ